MDKLKLADYQPQIELEAEYPDIFDNVPVEDGESLEINKQAMHDELLAYLLTRIESDTDISARRSRYASIDKIISTWQRLSAEDTKRKQKQEETGKAQAVAMNLPVIRTHVDELTAFLTDIYSPHTGSYFATPTQDTMAGLNKLTERMNEDAAASGFYVQTARASRAMLKYNIGGFTNDWVAEEVGNDSAAMEAGINWARALDMYNTWWDPSITDPSKIRLEGEWFGYAEIINRMNLVRREQEGQFTGCSAVLDAGDASGFGFGSKGKYYRYPPVHAGVSANDSLTGEFEGSSTVDWASFNRALSDTTAEIRNGYELFTIYCWLNPADFGLTYAGEDKTLQYPTDGYFLWRFKILSGTRIIAGEPVNQVSDAINEQGKTVIPVYMGYLQVDDMMGADRSVAELLVGFQTFASFLMNAHVQGARSSIWGVKTYDPDMFNIDALESGDGTAAYLASNQPGRDVRTGFSELKGTFDGGKTMDQIGGVMSLMQQLFPAQALPSQVAGLDRAIESQVSALMQGVTRRLQMYVRLADQSTFNPLRFDQATNLVSKGKLNLQGVTNKQIRKALGSGLEQLDREVAEASIRQIVFAMMQNPTIVENYDINTMLELWGSMLKTPVDVAKMRLQKTQPAAPPAPVPTDQAPGPTAIGLPV